MNLIKLCVGVDSVEDLAARQALRMKMAKKIGAPAELCHTTRMMPKQRAVVEKTGSIYWVIKGAIRARQKIIALRAGEDGEGRSVCDIILDPNLIETRAYPRRPFQGWRYLKPEEAPADLSLVSDADSGKIPSAMRAELTELALI